jgi:hypothetical protein
MQTFITFVVSFIIILSIVCGIAVYCERYKKGN